MHCWKNPGCSCCKRKEPLFNGKCFISSQVPGWEFTLPTLVHVELVALGAVWAQSCWCSVAGTWQEEAVAFSLPSVTQGLPLLLQLPESQILLIYFLWEGETTKFIAHTTAQNFAELYKPWRQKKKKKKNPQSVEIRFLLRKNY